LALSIPTAEIVWKVLPTLSVWTAKTIAKRFIIDISEEGKYPSISVFHENAQIRYKFLINTHGIPKYSKRVKFSKVLSLGRVTKKIVTPPNFGEIDGSMKLKLFTDEMPANSELSLFVDFDLEIDPRNFVRMNFRGSESITPSNLEIEVLAASNCDFTLEQIRLEVSKSTNFKIKDALVLILDKTSHEIKGHIEGVIKNDDGIRWITHLDPHESILFRVVTLT
jgi:hypothetical protein